MSELLDELPATHLEYPLRNGVVGDWLVLGPLTAPLTEPAHAFSTVARQLALSGVFVDADELVRLPAERATSSITVAEGAVQEGMWRVVNTLEDGCVDLAHHVERPSSSCAWLYAQVVLPARTAVPLLLTTASPTQLWINGNALYSYEELADLPTRLSFDAPLDEGTNEILVRVANVGVGDVPMMVALEIPGAEGVVTLPTLLEPVARRQKLATVMGHAYLAQAIYSREQRIVLRWPTDIQMVDALTARLQTPAGRIYGEANPIVQKGAKVDFGEASQFPDGFYEILLQPQFEEYYVQNMRVQHRIPLHVANGKWSTVYYGSHAERRQEALEDAARRGAGIPSEISKSALGEWDALRHDTIEETVAALAQRVYGYEQSLLALLGWVARMGDLPDFPHEVAWALEERAPLLLDHLDAHDTVVWITSHLLAGQLYPQRNFADLNTGEWHRTEAETLLLYWLRAAAQTGLPAGENEQSYADAYTVLSHLVDLAQSDEIAEMAAVVLDKVAYQQALQCFLGAWGGSQECGHMRSLAGARLGPLSGVARLWWGQGAFNAECGATVALACAENYALPEIIAAVGLDRQQESALQRQDVVADATSPLRTNRAAYRTGDYLLASAQGDFAAGTPSLLWQVTLGPDALVFGNRPAWSSSHNAWRDNYWRGNAGAARVAQWNDVLMVGYGAAEAARLDFSHAYFPRANFEDVLIGDGWAMARKGNGYVALTATGGVSLVTSGPTAQRELRAAAESVWLVQMGRAAHVGSFAQFVEKVMAQPLSLERSKAVYRSLRGQRIAFDCVAPLDQALMVDGAPQPLENFPHLASIYGGAPALPASSVEIHYQEHTLRLDLGTPEVPSAA